MRVDREYKKISITHAKGCLYCGLQLPEDADFCPECGRPIERCQISYATRESDCPDIGIDGKDNRIQVHEASSGCCDPLADEIHGLHDEYDSANLIHTLTIIAARHR
jgi:hypothetical protein